MPRTGMPHWIAPGVSTRVCVEGAYLKGPRALKGETFEKPNSEPGADGKKEEELFTPVSKSEAWLVEAVSGKHFSQRLLKRSTVFEELKVAALRTLAKQGRAPADAEDDPQMSALRYEEDSDSEDDVEATPVRKRRRSSAAHDKGGVASPEKTPMPAVAAAPVVVRMNQTATTSPAQLHDVSVVLRGKSLLLGVSSVPWLIGYLVQEMEDGGVVVETKASVDAESSSSSMYWDFRDTAWIARVQLDGQKELCKRVYLKTRMRTPGDRLHGMSRSDAKAAAHEELVAWREAALRGEVDETGAPAAAETFRV